MQMFTAWKVSVFEVILVRIFSHLDWIRENADQNNSNIFLFIYYYFLFILYL